MRIMSTSVGELSLPSPESNYGEEALLLEDESEARRNKAEDNNELIDFRNTNTNCLDSQCQHNSEWPAKISASPYISTQLYQNNKPALTGAGLENLGNTCFLSSIMQCFIHTVPFLHCILSDKHQNCSTERFCILCALQSLIKLSLTWKNGPIQPLGLVNNLSYFSQGFRRFQQEDAHEFLQCFLDRLESCHDSSQSDNIVKQVFGGRIVSLLRCCKCGHSSDTYEPSIDLSLEIENADNLIAALQSFTEVEKIDDPETKFTCEKCKEQVSIEKQLSIDQAPLVAVFHLKRFKNDGCLVHKIDKHVAFPLDLDMLPFTVGGIRNDMELKYVVYAIVVHVGLTYTSGHYYCFIRLSPNTWCKFDDSKVELVSEDFVMSQEAYILFYAKEGTSWFSSFIETQTFFCLDSHTWNTSPKSVLDRVGTSPLSSNLENKISHNDIKSSEHKVVDYNIENKNRGLIPKKNEIVRSTDKLHRTSILLEPRGVTLSSDVPPTKVHKEVDPNLLEKINRGEEARVAAIRQIDKPLRSPSPEIYREDPPDVGFSIPRGHLRMIDRVACKRRLDKDMDDLETRQAYSFIKKSMHGSRGQQMLAALRGSKTDAFVNRRKSRKSGQVDPSIRSVVSPLTDRTHM